MAMTRDEAVPGAVVVRVNGRGERINRNIYRIHSHYQGTEVFLWILARGHWRRLVAAKFMEHLRLATESERKEAGL